MIALTTQAAISGAPENRGHPAAPPTGAERGHRTAEPTKSRGTGNTAQNPHDLAAPARTARAEVGG
ncbi:hypothetical protein H4W32_005535 [Actinophytocola algeriensis]|uniref:Uncharacterized protein n=1 Tax=Actinophytocola algeriensis TaxID=1768010 RepID=A0A7W7VJF3_9PSEU|nr:hypothetical protein [Actinophytocola algeriensis]MBE1477493.1 hypothetical protein [Actinophytocola algeriensis]